MLANPDVSARRLAAEWRTFRAISFWKCVAVGPSGPRRSAREVRREGRGQPALGGLGSSMATIVLRVRLIGGEHTDLTYEDPGQVDEGEMVEQVIEVLREESGVLRCRHGDRLVVLYARGVASIEMGPRGAIV